MKRYLKYIFLFVLFCFPLFPKALDRTYVLYVCNFNNSTCSRYITLNDGQIDRGAIINHDEGSFPNAQTFFLGQTNWQNQKRYIINIDYTIKTGSALTYSSKFNHINTMFDTSARIGTTEYTLLSSSVSGGIYTYHYSIRSDITFPRTVSSLALHANFSTFTRVTYIKVNSWSVTEVTNNNTDIINNNNQNTTNIINNNNQNTENIINNQNENTQEIINSITDDTVSGNSVANKFAELGLISDTPITDLITMPVVLLQKLYNGMSGSCSSYTLPFNIWGSSNYNLTLPCFNGQQTFGSVWNVLDGLISLFMLYNIGMMVVQFFEEVTSLQDTFDSMYVPQHIYKPKHGRDN